MKIACMIIILMICTVVSLGFFATGQITASEFIITLIVISYHTIATFRED